MKKHEHCHQDCTETKLSKFQLFLLWLAKWGLKIYILKSIIHVILHACGIPHCETPWIG